MANEIKTRITVDVADGIAKVTEFGKAGETALKGIDQAAKGAAQSVQSMGAALNTAVIKSTVSFEQMLKGIATANVPRPAPLPGQPGFIGPIQPPRPPAPPRPPGGGDGEGRDAVDNLRIAFRALVPALNAAGISVGNLSPIMFAARGGALALAAAIGGSLIVAFEKSADAANDAASRLGAFAGGMDKGKEAFTRLQDLAKELQISPQALVRPSEQLTRLAQATPDRFTPRVLQETLSTVMKGALAEREVPAEKAAEAVATLFEDIRKNGLMLNEESFTKFAEVLPKTAAAIAKQLPPEQVAAGAVPAGEVVKAIQAASPEIARNIEQNAKQADSISTAWGHLAAAAENLAAALAGGDAISNAMNMLADWLNTWAIEVKRIKRERDELVQDMLDSKFRPEILPPTGPFDKFQPPVPEIPPLSPFGRPGIEATGSQFGGVFERIGSATGMGAALPELSDAAKKAAAEIGGLGDAVKRLEFGKLQKQLTAQGAVLGKAQAGLALDFLPEEQAIRTEKNQLAVQRATLAIKQAAIGAIEADKQQQLARLARETGEVNLGNARDQLEALRIQKQQREEGYVDQSRIDALQRSQERHAIQSAQLAVKRAEIEAKFPHLEEQKADLAVEQSQIAIRSAAIEKADASLTLAKDAAGQPIERSLAQLKYAQAGLDEQKALNTIVKEGNLTLQQILTAIKQLGKPASSSGAVTLAGGGPIHGLGSGTSDSIPAWLSHGEFVQSARAVSFYGADFMHALNSLRMPRFSAGGIAGLFSPSMPRFAGGGLVSANGAGPSHLGIVDLRTDHGSVSVMASSHAATQLQRLAVTKRITSTGRKPGFIA